LFQACVAQLRRGSRMNDKITVILLNNRSYHGKTIKAAIVQ
jgi:hypothetical protein